MLGSSCIFHMLWEERAHLMISKMDPCGHMEGPWTECVAGNKRKHESELFMLATDHYAKNTDVLL